MCPYTCGSGCFFTCPGDDAAAENSDDESEMAVFAEPTQEELYIEDPKKALRGFFEREGIVDLMLHRV